MQYLSHFLRTSCHILQHLPHVVINSSHSVIPGRLYHNFLSNFLIIFLQFVKLSQFVKNVFKKAQKEHVVLSYFVIKTGFLTNLDCMQIFTVYSFQKCQERRRPLLIDDVMVTGLFWKFWIFSNQLGKNIIKKTLPIVFSL